MAFHNNPRIVTDGLVLCLEANNSKSYPGSGNDWFDLTGHDDFFANRVTNYSKGHLEWDTSSIF